MYCATAWEQRRRAAVLDAIPKRLEIDFAKIHEWVEELVGRPVFTHEMGTDGMQYLRHEILTGDSPSLAGIMAKLPADKPIIPIVP